jgi:predicted peptidase
MQRAGFQPASDDRRFPPPPASRYELVPAPDAGADRMARAALAGLDALAERFEARTFRAPDGTVLPYRLLPPPAPAAGSRAPMVLLLHGAGEIGTDNRRQLTAFALAWARDEARARDQAFVVVPQMPARSAEYDNPASADTRTSRGTALVPAILALVDDLAATLPVDPGRIGVAGFSMGASTTWNLLHARPSFFAAAIPIAGVPRADQASMKTPTAIWVIHGNRDETNPIRHDRRAFVPLLDAGAAIRFSEIDHLAHEVPPTLLASGDLARFLLATGRQTSATPRAAYRFP